MATRLVPTSTRPGCAHDVSLSDNEGKDCLSNVDAHHLLIRTVPHPDHTHHIQPDPQHSYSYPACHSSPRSNSDDQHVAEWNSFSDNHNTEPSQMRHPIIYFPDYGVMVNWALNVFTLPHNAVRAECAALVNLVDVVSANFDQLDDLDVDDVHSWWSTFQVFIVEHFNFEADVLFPCAFPTTASFNTVVPLPEANIVRGDLPPPDLALKKSLQVKRDAILSLVGHLNSSFAVRRTSDLLNVLSDIANDVGALVPRVIGYLETVEDTLPSLLQRLYAPAAEKVLLRRYIDHIRRGPAPNTNLVLLTSWMAADKGKELVRASMGGWLRWRFQRLERRCQRMHTGIPSRLSNKVKKRSFRSSMGERELDVAPDDTMVRSLSAGLATQESHIETQVND